MYDIRTDNTPAGEEESRPADVSQVRQISCQIFCFHVDSYVDPAVRRQLAEQAA